MSRRSSASPASRLPGLWQHNRVSALFGSDEDVGTILRDAVAGIGLEQLPRTSHRNPGRQRLGAPHPIAVRADSDLAPIMDRADLAHPQRSTMPSISCSIPGLAFGTGSHPTTRLCLRWLDKNLKGGESVLDYGCGSGILAIAALKLGAAHAIGVDVDSQAVIASRDNAAANQIQNARVLSARCLSEPSQMDRRNPVLTWSLPTS